MKPKLLDLFCGGGGASMGYYRAGFDVEGVDIKPQPHYPFKFYQADALTFPIEGYDAYHASPPCQKYSMASRQWLTRNYPDLIELTREILQATGKPYVIENVPGAPLINPVILNGAMFGMNLRRRRLFECSFEIPLTLLPTEARSNFRMGRAPSDTDCIVPVGHFSGVERARQIMGIDWMTQGELSQAIPPAYTEYLGKYLISQYTKVEQALKEKLSKKEEGK